MEVLSSPTASYTVVRALSSRLAKRDVICTSDSHDGKLVAHLIEIHDDTPIESYRQLCQFMSALRDLRIPPLVDCFETGSEFCRVFPHIDGMSISEHLRDHGHMPEEEAKIVFTQVLDVVAYVHEAGFAHRNLSTDTLLLNQIFKVGLVGWSQATIKMAVPETCPKDPMSAFDPPEALAGKPSVGIYYDYWSLGVILYALLCGQPPWTGETPKELRFAMSSGNVLRPRDMSMQAHNLIMSFLDFDPLRRFSPVQAKAHAWLVGDREKAITKSASAPKTIMLRGKLGMRNPLLHSAVSRPTFG
jgi:serine/threonine protein kinase